MRRTRGRAGYAALAALLLAALIRELIRHRTGYWQAVVFGLGPDLALFVGIGAGLQKGQLHPRAVRLYNLLHRYWLPLALAIVAALDLVPFGYLIGALAWAFHISIDRAVGYGLRTREGFQRSS
jgi:uncharacterized membrane protein YecN with MAPEG domain